jgi:RimJ/RimL family protein N-acetyltransferase
MIFEEKKVTLKNGKDCILRSPGPEDAEVVLDHLRLAATETDFMIRYPEEITVTVKEEEEFLGKSMDDSKSLMIAAEVDGKIIADGGFHSIMDMAAKYSHRASFGIAVRKEFWNQGIGMMIVSELIDYAEKAGYEQMELEVDCRNEQAVRLYKKLGFEIYGTRERSFKFKDGTYSSFYLMLLPLGQAR